MSLLDIARARGRHRLLSPAELLAELTATRRQKDSATIAAIKYATLAEERLQQLDAAGIEMSGLRYDLGEAQREIDGLRAALANATATSSPASQREVGPGDEPTSPTGINVRPLWDALGIVPGSADPAHVPGRP